MKFMRDFLWPGLAQLGFARGFVPVKNNNPYKKDNIKIGTELKWENCETLIDKYRDVVSSNSSPFEAHPGIYKLLTKGIFDTYVL